PSSFYGSDFNNVEEVMINGKKWLKVNGQTNYIRLKRIEIDKNTEYTWSFDVFSEDFDGTLRLNPYVNNFNKTIDISKNKKRVFINFNPETAGNSTTFHIYSSKSEGYFYMADFKLEKGTKATDWTPAPEDTDAKISHIET